MKRYSRRQYLQGLFATSVFLALSQHRLCKAESSEPKTAKSSIWKLGIGADPAQLLAETKTIRCSWTSPGLVTILSELAQ